MSLLVIYVDGEELEEDLMHLLRPHCIPVAATDTARDCAEEIMTLLGKRANPLRKGCADFSDCFKEAN